MGNHNITPIVALKHCRNISITIDVPPSIGVIDIIVISTWGRRTDITESNGGGMDACYSGTSVTGVLEGMARRRGRESVHQRG